MRDGIDPVQDVADRLAQTAKETAEDISNDTKDSVRAREAMRTELTISTRTGPAACRIRTSHPGR